MSATTHLNLNAKSRDLLGNTGKKLRRQGILTAVIYGFNVSTPINISLQYNEFEKIYRKSGNTSVLDIDIDGKKFHTLVHDLQFHPVKDTFLHVDFLVVNLKKSVEAEVPLTFIGVPNPVKQDGAILNKSIEHVTVSALPDSIPQEIVVDLSMIITANDSIRVSDLKLNKGVEMITPLDEVIASVQFDQGDSEVAETPETVVVTGVASPEAIEKTK
jgi:large subunit ribosomal protein L25